MATSIVAPPIGAPQVPDWMVLNEFFDHPVIIGIPVWVFICVFFGFILLMVNLSWLFKIKRLSAVKGYRQVQKKAKPEDEMVIQISKSQKFLIECMKYVDSVISYYDQTKISKWHHTTPASVIHIGGFPAMMVSDDYDQTRDLVSEIALCHACDKFNSDQKWLTDLVMDMKEKKMNLPAKEDEIEKPINNFEDYETRGRILLEIRYPDGIPIPAYSIFNPGRFRKFFPKGRSAGFHGGVLDRQAKDLNVNVPETSLWKQYIPLVAIITFGLIGVIAAWMVPLGK